jgi:hypothetical protein
MFKLSNGYCRFFIDYRRPSINHIWVSMNYFRCFIDVFQL